MRLVWSSRSWLRRIFGWLVKAILIFLIGSVLWVLLYRFVNPPLTFTQLGDVFAGRRAFDDAMAAYQPHTPIFRMKASHRGSP